MSRTASGMTVVMSTKSAGLSAEAVADANTISNHMQRTLIA